MATRAPAFPVNDREFYPLHEEDDVPETEFHDLQTDYLCDALRACFPERRVFRNVCIYWVPGDTRLYRAPDVFVAADQPSEPMLRVYHIWQDPPVLFAAEIGSRSTFRQDEGPKQRVYSRDIKATEYLYANPPEGDLRLWRLGPRGRYEVVAPEPSGRVRSATLGLEFGIEDGWLWIYTPEGERLRTHEEAEQQLVEEAHLRRQAEERSIEEARRRAAAEACAAEAEARAREEQSRREELERRLAELEAQLRPRRS